MKKELGKEILNRLQEGISAIQEALPIGAAKTTRVVFDKSTKPYEVKFSERGFEIGSERFSFEFLETALSKNITITLDNGNGIVMDRIKMDKILKYKTLY